MRIPTEYGPIAQEERSVGPSHGPCSLMDSLYMYHNFANAGGMNVEKQGFMINEVDFVRYVLSRVMLTHHSFKLHDKEDDVIRWLRTLGFSKWMLCSIIN